MIQFYNRRVDERITLLEKSYPPRIIADPISAFQWQENVARCTGGTTEMIRHLPKNGNCVIVIPNHVMKDILLDEIKGMFPEIPVEKIKFVTVRTYHDVDEKISHTTRGLSDIPIFFDNSVLYILNKEMISRVNALYSHKSENKKVEMKKEDIMDWIKEHCIG